MNLKVEDICYDYAGAFTSRGEWIHPEITIETYEIIIVFEGEFIIEENGKEYLLKSGDGIILEPGKLHRGVEPTNERVSFYWIHFKSDKAIQIKQFTLRDRYPVTLLCRQLLHYGGCGFDTDVVTSIVYVLLQEINSQIFIGDSDDILVNQIREWIRINSDRNMNAADLAERFGYSEDYISRLFKSKTGKSLKMIIDEYKMNHLKWLLLESELSLSEVADSAGFSDYKLFLKYFKYHEGMTPTEFRKVYYSKHTNNK
ncbi:MAG: AraC family transcriptional regulator [Clostridiales bacterium]|nr:AraC family transcriptional regulator [Clostridiales bacterium]